MAIVIKIDDQKQKYNEINMLEINENKFNCYNISKKFYVCETNISKIIKYFFNNFNNNIINEIFNSIIKQFGEIESLYGIDWFLFDPLNLYLYAYKSNSESDLVNAVKTFLLTTSFFSECIYTFSLALGSEINKYTGTCCTDIVKEYEKKGIVARFSISIKGIEFSIYLFRPVDIGDFSRLEEDDLIGRSPFIRLFKDCVECIVDSIGKNKIIQARV
ncbi:hypothetical protein PYJP_06300 [Pyrofollis japonicus]|uniref:hypothetical protein n=1 Tax=Pyrofollis japonicus TaxID=3060460 RepID=UPI00295C122D|nr:hypothetical protein [Pyrofollis japonicus]BEP17278.1 hypothetical protein PYJP_06300 [Pyrofollis japonicus]